MSRFRAKILGHPSRALSLIFMVGTLVGALVADGRARSSLAAQDDEGVLVAFVNGLPGEPLVAVSVDGAAVADGVAYAQVTDEIRLDAGSRRVTVSETESDGAALLVEAELDLSAGGAYVIAAFDQEGGPALGRWRLDRNPAGSGQSRVELLHLSPDTPSVDVAVEGGDVLIAGVGFTDPPVGAVVDAGTYDLEMRPAGSTDVVQLVPDVIVEAGTVNCVLGLGFLADDGSLDIITFATPLNEGSLPSGGVGVAVGTPSRPAWPVWLLGTAALAAALVALVALRGGHRSARHLRIASVWSRRR